MTIIRNKPDFSPHLAGSLASRVFHIRARTAVAAIIGFIVTSTSAMPTSAADLAGTLQQQYFRRNVAPILERHCLRCHRGTKAAGKLDLSHSTGLRRGGESGPVFISGKPEDSLLIEYISGDEPEMPKNSRKLSAKEVAVLRKWIVGGAGWPQGLVLKQNPRDWWSLRPIVRPSLPKLAPRDQALVRTPIDAFVIARLRDKGLSLSPEADRRTLIRRLYFDLIGLPPSPRDVRQFLDDRDPKAYEHLVDRLLASKHYGERWARHWLDVVHYGDTHGYDKDKPRPHAWPYRDYVIRAFNEDKPYARFVREQLAGDVFYPETTDGIVATGFIAAGPWDLIGHAEVPESKIDGKIARNLDRDDMVATTMNTFMSMTVQCARCHDHKFDPVIQEDYYSLQAVFAALDRADRPYDISPEIARQRAMLASRRRESTKQQTEILAEIKRRGGQQLAAVDRQIALLSRPQPQTRSAAFGYHSRIEQRDNVVKWVQVDLGRETLVDRIVYVGCHDTFNNIGAGFGFPKRYKVEISNDPAFKNGVTVVEDRTDRDVPNPGVKPNRIVVGGKTGRYVRITATRLAVRKNDYIFALAELMVLASDGTDVAMGKPVTSLDSIEAPVRWQRKNLVDGYYYGIKVDTARLRELATLKSKRQTILKQLVPASVLNRLAAVDRALQQIDRQISRLPRQQQVYAGTVHTGSGAFRGTGSNGGRPREIHLLIRGDVRRPGKLVVPGAVRDIVPGVSARFTRTTDQPEGERRRALAEWILHRDNPLTWRSIVNRVWGYHFGRALVASPNDFGHMGQRPSHPLLLDWLAAEFRDGDQSLKRLHRLIVTSTVYRQSSEAIPTFDRIDHSNRFLWRMNRRRLDAESLRDAVLFVSGQLNTKMYGPGFRDFVLEKPQHSPHYEYGKYDPNNPASFRRAIYRFLVRSQPQPFMNVLDCADPSQRVARRDETLTALQALTLMNNPFMVIMATHFSQRIAQEAGNLPAQIDRAYRLTLSRSPTPEEQRDLVAYARKFGLANTCRLILNLNEFVFVD